MRLMAVDPGKDKTGIAVVDSNNSNIKIKFKDIINSKELDILIHGLLEDYHVDKIIIGNGTYHEKIKKMIERETTLPVIIVDEAYSTLEAEKRYRKEKHNWLSRFFNWKPDCPLDDYVAVILAERYLQNR